jgi:exocyst complex protein 7
VSNLAANQNAMKDLTALIKYGVRQLDELFKQTLQTFTPSQVEPLHFITKGTPPALWDCLTVVDKPFPTLPDKESPSLRLIHRFISSSTANSSQTSLGDYTTFKMYADIRGSYMARSLATSAAASMSTARKLNQSEMYKRGTCGIGSYTSALEGMLASEFDNIRNIFPRDDWARVLLTTSRSALNDFGKTLRDLNTHIQTNLMTDCFLAYEIMEIINGLLRRLDAKIPDVKKPIAELAQPIRDTARNSLTKILEDTKTRVQSLISLPMEGSAIPLTVDIMTRLQVFPQYLPTITSIMAAIGDGNWTPASPTSSAAPSLRSFDGSLSGPESNALFAHYCSDILETLVSALDSRARLLLKSTQIQSIFMCNNISVIENMVRTSELGTLLGAVQQRIDTWKSKHLKLYLASWSQASSQLLDVQYTNRASSSGRPTSSGAPDSATVVRGLNTKERDIIKEKFRAFNGTFDTLVANHRNAKMEPDVRALLGGELQHVIDPLYNRFWDRYHEVDKGKGKYVKYSKTDMAAIFAGLRGD